MPVDLTPRELKAVLDHKYHMAEKRGCDIPIEEAIDDFFTHVGDDWRQRVHSADIHEEQEELSKVIIEPDTYQRNSRILKLLEQGWAENWRKERESPKANGIFPFSLTVQNPMTPLHILVWDCYCSVFVNRPSMQYVAFAVKSVPYVDVKAHTAPLSKGDEMHFLLSGMETEKAYRQLERIAEEASLAIR
jgi:hypothetical protein